MRTKTHRITVPGRVRIAVAFVSILAPVIGIAATKQHSETAPYTQEFVLTAYYSPLPGQCCYVTGSFDSDKVLNGNGTNGADGVPVHPGMAAAPSTFPFGTRIAVPGIGVLTVDDRGGAITDAEGKSPRLDVWMGMGEEGLARALKFGVKRITATVYPLGTTQPPESVSLDAIASPLAMLKPYAGSNQTLLSLQVKKGDTGLSVLLLQEALHASGFFDRNATGFFGDDTESALKEFNTAYGLNEPSAVLTRRTAAFLIVASQSSESSPVTGNVSPGSDSTVVREAQRTMRYLGYYRGRTNGQYDSKLRAAIFAFQKKESILGSVEDQGAGTIGPRTSKVLAARWRQKVTALKAENILLLASITDLIQAKNIIPQKILAKGDTGEQVRILQRILVSKGFLPPGRATGNFGSETEKAVLAYQLKAKVILKKSDKGAGVFGMFTRMRMASDVRQQLFEVARAKGIAAL
jgi:peptidoglycan hydrolase-like protein with peptidoglycan-binding domain/3D (Asp-Asp-Asp) domain-containing protein